MIPITVEEGMLLLAVVVVVFVVEKPSSSTQQEDIIMTNILNRNKYGYIRKMRSCIEDIGCGCDTVVVVVGINAVVSVMFVMNCKYEINSFCTATRNARRMADVVEFME